MGQQRQYSHIGSAALVPVCFSYMSPDQLLCSFDVSFSDALGLRTSQIGFGIGVWSLLYQSKAADLTHPIRPGTNTVN